MKILFDHPCPFFLAHGGVQTQIEQTQAALERIGVSVEPVRWWDAAQAGDLVHFFGLPGTGYLQLACRKGLKIVTTSFFSAECNRADWRLRAQGFLVQALLAVPFGHGITQKLPWLNYTTCAHNVVGLHAEKRVLQFVYYVPDDAISVVPLGLDEAFLTAGTAERSAEHLICVGTITEVKGSIELAELARAAQVPVLFVGRPYDSAVPYWLRFQKLIDDRWVKYHPQVAAAPDLAALLKAARGFVLLSRWENWSLAAHEGAACGLPLLLPDQKWSRERFGSEARYFSRSTQYNVELLRQFHRDAPSLPPPAVKLFSWIDVAKSLQAVYERVLNNSA